MESEYFFTVIIPTYNPGQYLDRMLESISHNECADKIKVIISDDCSTEPFDEILEKHNKLKIQKISNEKHSGFPRNGRQHGAEEVDTPWFCFADQDDYFVDNAFDKIYKFITESNAKNYIITNFIEQKEDTGELIVRDKTKGWTHGKFYEKEFWTKYKIRYDNVQYCEDINLSSKITCIIIANGLQVYEYDDPIYVWCRRKDSLADIRYFIDSMQDYAKGTLGVTLKYIEKYKNNEDVLVMLNMKFFATFLHFYFYFQSPELKNEKEVLLKTVLLIQPMFKKFKEYACVTNNDIINLINGELMPVYSNTRTEDYNQIPFTEQITFKEWLDVYFG